MSDLIARFEVAVTRSKNLSERPDDTTLLQLYALYKQAMEGGVEGKRPGIADLTGRAKYDAWAAIDGMAADEAMARYIALIEPLQLG